MFKIVSDTTKMQALQVSRIKGKEQILQCNGNEFSEKYYKQMKHFLKYQF